MCNIPDRAELYFEVRIISEPRLDICHIIQKVYSEINDSRENLFFSMILVQIGLAARGLVTKLEPRLSILLFCRRE